MNSEDSIVIKGAREHNLKSIDLKLPRGALVVFTGLSGSGKSSLAFDTIYAEGQRRYVESLSAYARQFLDRMQKPDVDSIEGLSPAISIEQRVAGSNPRSTVGTTTEIYDYLRLLYAKTGVAHCPTCDRKITRQSAQEIVAQILSAPRDTKVQVLAPLVEGRKGEYQQVFKDAQRDGFVRVRVDGQTRELSEKIVLDKKKKHTIEIVVDRLVLKDDAKKRLTDSVESALKTGKGMMKAVFDNPPRETAYSELYACVHCALSFAPPEPRLFSFNSPYGACPECDGLGNCLEIDPELVVPDKSKSIRGGAIAPWNRGGKSIFIYYRRLLRHLAERTGFSLDAPWRSLTKEQKDTVLRGEEGGGRWQFEGVIPNLERRFKETESEFMKEEIHKYMGLKPCTACRGKRLKPEALSVRVQGKNIMELCALAIEDSEKFFRELPLSKTDETIARPILKEVRARLGFMANVGLGYLSLDRMSGTLSGGEAQRIRLATQIGSGLMGVLYVLDEPSIGLHQRDNEKLLTALKSLRDLGNTLIVVEHDEATMKSADWLVDLGPGAGKHGGRVVAAGKPEAVMGNPASLTGKYLTGELSIAVPEKRRPLSGGKKITIKGARENNLKNTDIEIPLGVFVCVTGVSGSGKSTLVDEILFKGLSKKIYRSKAEPGKHDAILGAEAVDKVIEIDQSPIGRTPRSNPATYTGLFGPIRDLFAKLPEARVRGYRPGRFSFNVKGGRCEACEGDGVKTIEMHFLPDVYVPCEVCKGRRFNEQTLEVRYKGRTIADVLAMSVEEALGLFSNVPAVRGKLQTLHDVGLDYIEIGQAATTLSGGEAQRIKLSTELSRRATGRTFYILDEPTTGLHFADIDRLLKVLHALVDQGNTVLVIEHNLDVVKTADYVIDLGPEGGNGGGRLVAAGTPEAVARSGTHTGRVLKPLLKKMLVAAACLALFAAPARAAQDEPEKTQFRIAEAHFEAKDYSSAIRGYGELLEKYPSSKFAPYASYSLAWSRYELKDYEGAIEEFRRFAKEFPGDRLAPDARYKIGQSFHAMKKYDSAVSELSAFVRDVPLSPKAAGAWYLIGDSQYNLGETAPALEAFKKSLELGPQSEFRAFALHGVGWSYFELGRYEEALNAFAPFETEVSDSAVRDSFLFGKARALGKLGRHFEALEAYDRMLADFPDSGLTDQAMLWKAETLFALGRTAEAAQTNEEAIRRFPSGSSLDDLRYNLAWTYARLGRSDDALAEFRAVAETSSDEVLRVSALCRIGDTLLEKGDLETALETYDSVLRDFPKSIDSDYAQYQSAAALLRLGRFDAAILSFQSLPVHFPSSRYLDEALFGLGMALLQRGSNAEASAAFSKLLSSHPESPLRARAYFQLGNAAFNAGDAAKALEIFKDLAGRADAPEVARAAQAQAGWTLIRVGKDAEGVAMLEDFLSRFGDSDDAAGVGFGLGDYYFGRGDYARAREFFRAAAETFPSNALADDARYRFAASLEREGDASGAVAAYRKLAADYPNGEWAARGLLAAADVLVAQGLADEAKAEALKALALPAPGALHALARKKIGEILKTQGHLREAELSLREALASAEGDLACEIHFALAETIEGEGERERAASEYLKLTYLYPGNRIYSGRAFAQAAKLYEDLGKPQDALKVYEKLSASGFPEAAEADRRIAAIRGSNDS